MSEQDRLRQQWREDFDEGALARMTDLQIRSELREVATKLAELRRRRDQLIHAALRIGVRPADVALDSGLGKTRIYQIKDEVADS